MTDPVTTPLTPPRVQPLPRLTHHKRRTLRTMGVPKDQTRLHACVVSQYVPDQSAEIFVTEDMDDSRILGAVVQFMRDMAQVESAPEGASISERGRVGLLPWGRRLHNLVRTPIDTVVEKYHLHGCHPYVGAYLRALDMVVLHRIESLVGSNEEVAAEYAKALQSLHAEVHAEPMRRLIQKFLRTSRKCYRGTVDMVHKAVLRHAKLLSVRMDLSYRSANPMLRLAHLSHAQAKIHLAAFLRHVRRKTGLKVVAYCWAMEFAPTAGCHFHLWFLFNGHHHQDAAAIGHQLGIAWSTGLTEGQGRYYLCNQDKKRYAHLAVGMLHRASIDWEGVHYIAAYLTKPDFYLQYQPKEGGRTFGRSCIKSR